MKKVILFTALIPLSFIITAQNIQLHYDVGRQEDGTKRNFFVSTFELFRPDTLGYTFLFTDFEFNSPDNPRGVSLGYFEISRTFSLGRISKSRLFDNLMIHAEYNDGNVIYPISDSVIAGENLRSCWLGGPEYGLSLGDLTLNAMFLYKYIRGSAAPDFQFTLVWFYPLFNQRIIFTGYIDIWTQDDFFNNPDNKITVLYSEPQLWYNLTGHLYVGSECKISKNFVFGSRRPEFFPTLGIKWEF